MMPGLYRHTINGRPYYYAWRGGPRIKAEPDTPEFIAAYEAAIALVPAERRAEVIRRSRNGEYIVREDATRPARQIKPRAFDHASRAKLCAMVARGVGLTGIAAVLRMPYRVVGAEIDRLGLRP